MRFEALLLDLQWLTVKALFEEYCAKAGFNPNQPRVAAGNPDSGQWTDTGGGALTGGSQEDRLAPVDSQHPDMDAAIRHLRAHAKPNPTSNCAKYVRIALNVGGFDVKPSGEAKNYGSSLIKAGFKGVVSENQPASYPSIGYEPETGDVVVIQATSKSSAGHMAMYDGWQWISDFRQHAFWPGSSYRIERPRYVIYRYGSAKM